MLVQFFMSEWKFRSVFLLTIFLRVLASCVDIIIVMRWNTLIGINDHVMYMLGYNIVYQVCPLSALREIIAEAAFAAWGLSSAHSFVESVLHSYASTHAHTPSHSHDTCMGRPVAFIRLLPGGSAWAGNLLLNPPTAFN